MRQVFAVLFPFGPGWNSGEQWYRLSTDHDVYASRDATVHGSSRDVLHQLVSSVVFDTREHM